MRQPFTLVLAVAVTSLSRAAELPGDAKTALDKATQIEVYSLDPVFPEEDAKKAFHGWKVLGKTTIKDEKQRKALVVALEKGVKEREDKAPECFQPRHGLRVVRDGKTVDLVICFQCYTIQVFVGKEDKRDVLIGRSPQPALDKLLTDAGIKLAPKPEK